MSLRIYNTLYGKKEEFVPVNKGKVGIYGSYLGRKNRSTLTDIYETEIRDDGYAFGFVSPNLIISIFW